MSGPPPPKRANVGGAAPAWWQGVLDHVSSLTKGKGDEQGHLEPDETQWLETLRESVASCLPSDAPGEHNMKALCSVVGQVVSARETAAALQRTRGRDSASSLAVLEGDGCTAIPHSGQGNVAACSAVFDGRRDTHWSPSSAEGDPWVGLDLGRGGAAAVKRFGIRLVPRPGSCDSVSTGPRSFSLQGRADATGSWKVLYRVADAVPWGSREQRSFSVRHPRLLRQHRVVFHETHTGAGRQPGFDWDAADWAVAEISFLSARRMVRWLPTSLPLNTLASLYQQQPQRSIDADPAWWWDGRCTSHRPPPDSDQTDPALARRPCLLLGRLTATPEHAKGAEATGSLFLEDASGAIPVEFCFPVAPASLGALVLVTRFHYVVCPRFPSQLLVAADAARNTHPPGHFAYLELAAPPAVVVPGADALPRGLLQATGGSRRGVWDVFAVHDGGLLDPGRKWPKELLVDVCGLVTAVCPTLKAREVAFFMVELQQLGAHGTPASVHLLLSGAALSWQQLLRPVDCVAMFSRLQRVIMFKGKPGQRVVLRATSRSRVATATPAEAVRLFDTPEWAAAARPSPTTLAPRDAAPCPPTRRLLELYEGTITSTVDAERGIYGLDFQLLLVCAHQAAPRSSVHVTEFSRLDSAYRAIDGHGSGLLRVGQGTTVHEYLQLCKVHDHLVSILTATQAGDGVPPRVGGPPPSVPPRVGGPPPSVPAAHLRCLLTSLQVTGLHRNVYGEFWDHAGTCRVGEPRPAALGRISTLASILQEAASCATSKSSPSLPAASATVHCASIAEVDLTGTPILLARLALGAGARAGGQHLELQDHTARVPLLVLPDKQSGGQRSCGLRVGGVFLCERFEIICHGPAGMPFDCSQLLRSDAGTSNVSGLEWCLAVRRSNLAPLDDKAGSDAAASTQDNSIVFGVVRRVSASVSPDNPSMPVEDLVLHGWSSVHRGARGDGVNADEGPVETTIRMSGKVAKQLEHGLCVGEVYLLTQTVPSTAGSSRSLRATAKTRVERANIQGVASAAAAAAVHRAVAESLVVCSVRGVLGPVGRGRSALVSVSATIVSKEYRSSLAEWAPASAFHEGADLVVVRLSDPRHLDTIDMYLDVKADGYPLALMTPGGQVHVYNVTPQVSEATGRPFLRFSSKSVMTPATLATCAATQAPAARVLMQLAILGSAAFNGDHRVHWAVGVITTTLLVTAQWKCMQCGGHVSANHCPSRCPAEFHRFTFGAHVLFDDGTCKARALASDDVARDLLRLSTSDLKALRKEVRATGPLLARKPWTGFDNAWNVSGAAVAAPLSCLEEFVNRTSGLCSVALWCCRVDKRELQPSTTSGRKKHARTVKLGSTEVQVAVQEPLNLRVIRVDSANLAQQGAALLGALA